MRVPVRSAVTILVATLSLVACGYEPTIRHPELTPLAAIDATMSCPQIDSAIDRADTVRWVIRDDGGHLETRTKREVRILGNIILVSMSILGGGAPTGMDDGGHAKLGAADSRIRELLKLKRDRGCPSRPTAIAELDDLALLGALDEVQKQLDAVGEGDGEEARLFLERTRLLDGLRVVPEPEKGASRATRADGPLNQVSDDLTIGPAGTTKARGKFS